MGTIVWTTLPVSAEKSGSSVKLKFSVSASSNFADADAALYSAFRDWPTTVSLAAAKVKVFLVRGIAEISLGEVATTIEINPKLWSTLFPSIGVEELSRAPKTSPAGFPVSGYTASQLYEQLDGVHQAYFDLQYSLASQEVGALQAEQNLNANLRNLDYFLQTEHDRDASSNAMRRVAFNGPSGNLAARNAQRLAADPRDITDETLATIETQARTLLSTGVSGLGTARYETDGSVDPDKFREALTSLYRTGYWATPSDAITKAEQLLFFQQLSLIRNHPKLLRPLGLAFDVEMSIDASVMPGVDGIRVEPSSAIPGVGMASPITSLEAASFVVKNTAHVENNYLRLNDGSRFGFGTFDVEAAIMATHQYSIHLNAMSIKFLKATVRSDADRVLGVREAASIPPSRRSSAITVFMKDRPDFVNNLLAKMKALQTGAENRLDADSIASGFVVFVKAFRPVKDRYEPVGDWTSHCLRDEIYTVDGMKDPLSFCGVNGMVRATTTRPTDRAVNQAEAPEELEARESIFSIGDWSCTVTSEFVGEDESEGQSVKWPFQVSYSVPDTSLYPARFLWGYLLCAVAMDVTGNQLGLPSDTHASPLIILQRHEPVCAPYVLLQKTIAGSPYSGDSLDHIVYRDGVDNGFVARYLIPPRVDLSLAERHGLFDGLDETKREDKEKLDLLLKGFQGVTFDKDGDVLKSDGNPIFQEPDRAKEAVPPYFPDPLVAGVAIAVENLATGRIQSASLPFYLGSAWPNASPLQIHVQTSQDGEIQIAPKPSKHRFELTIPKGVIAKVRLSCLTDTSRPYGSQHPDCLSLHLAMKARLSAATESEERSRIGKLIQHSYDGQNEMTSPSRDLLVSHAVREPLLDPKIHEKDASGADWIFIPDRLPGENQAELYMLIDVDRKSTGKITQTVTWSSPEPTNPCENLQNKLRVSEDGVELRPTKSAPPPGTESTIDFSGSNHKTIVFPDTAHRIVNIEVSAETRFTDYYDKSTQFKTKTASVRALVRNCGVPPVPVVDYAIPSFEWSGQPLTSAAGPASQQGSDESRTVSTRRCRIRVVLSCPWNLTGPGELLGVGIKPDAVPNPDTTCADLESDPDDRYRSYFAGWGMDPTLKRVGNLPLFPSKDDLLKYVEYRENVSLQEFKDRSDRVASIVGYLPDCSARPGSVICDVGFTSNVPYGTLVRLPLFRFQPHSIAKTLVSQMVALDFIPLAPQRSVTLLRIAKDKLEVVVRGLENPGGSDAGGNKIVVEVLELARIGNSELWVTDDKASCSLGVKQSGELWRGTLTFGGRGRPRQIAIREMESHKSEGNIWVVPVEALVDRLVYADVVGV